jgi:cell wall-associated NlpC family hydrolase
MRTVQAEPQRPRPVAVRPTATPSPTPPPRKRRAASRVLFSAIVMTFATALVATLALPSYAFDPRHGSTVQAAGRQTTRHGDQRLDPVASGVSTAKLTRDAFTATSSAELKRAQLAKAYSSYSGPTASDYIKNPAHPPFSLEGVYETALKYRGVPYVFGGADPSGFDCSGFIMFIYAQFGVSLPHSVHQQDQIGTTIPASEARPGDVIVFNDESHDGFVAPDGMILHAPYSGVSVRQQPLWSDAVHYVRFGIG